MKNQIVQITSYSSLHWVCPVCFSVYDDDFDECQDCYARKERRLYKPVPDDSPKRIGRIGRGRPPKPAPDWATDEQLWKERLERYRRQGIKAPKTERDLRFYHRRKAPGYKTKHTPAHMKTEKAWKTWIKENYQDKGLKVPVNVSNLRGYYRRKGLN